MTVELNRIYNEDCIKALDHVDDGSIDLVVTDPPYLHVKGGMSSSRFNVGKTWAKDSVMTQKMSDFGKSRIYEFLDAVIPKMQKVNMYVFCSKLQLIHYFTYIAEHKKLKYDLLVWDKDKKAMKSSKFHTSDIEYLIRIYEPGVSLNKVLTEDGSKSDIEYYLKRQVAKQPKGAHSTMKPVELIERLIKVSSNEGGIVLDGFLGSGTTAVACINTNRNFIGFELDPEYHAIAEKRIQDAINEKQTKEGEVICAD